MAALLALLALAEVAVRVRERVAPSAQELIREQLEGPSAAYVPDSQLGALLAPDQRDTIRSLDYAYVFRSDHAGFPNREPWPERADVVVLGNSLLDGPGLGLDGQFTTLLERRLGGRSVMNFGLPGGGTEHERLIYERYAAPLHPRLVVAMLWPTWDIENSRQFARWRAEGKPDPDYTHYRFSFGVRHDEAGRGEPSPVDHLKALFKRELRRSHLATAAYHTLKALRRRSVIHERATFANGDTLLLSVRDQQRLALGMERPDTPDLREIFFRPLEELRAEVEASGGTFLVVLMPSKEELYGSRSNPVILKPIQEVRAGLESRGIPTLDLYPILGRQWPEGPAPFYHADMHPNALGNRIIADAIHDWIVARGVFESAGR